MLSDDVLFALAPLSLQNYRLARYTAADQAIDLVSFAESDRAVVVRLYGLLTALMQLLEVPAHDLTFREADGDDALGSAFEAILARLDFSGLIHALQRIGRDVAPGSPLAAAIHDVRGGALSALSMEAHRALRRPGRFELWRSLYFLARDHAKVMRNLVGDLDPERRAADLRLKAHGTLDLARAMRELPAEIDGAAATIDVDCRADVTIAESCVEFGAVDRVVYNLLNNAVRHAASTTLSAWILPVGKNLRVAIANVISSAQEERLRDELAGGRLRPGFTTTGSGVGLRVVTALVGSAYGLADASEVTADGYCGARVIGQTFVTWFHWPTAGA